MGFNPEWAFRDCPWCHAHDTHMPTVGAFTTSRVSKSPRSWSAMSCSRCGGIVILEYNDVPGMPSQLLGEFPPTEDHRTKVESLPDDVSDYYANAIKALQVGLYDASGVELRKTLEAATGHKGATTGQLYKRVEKLIEEKQVTQVFAPALGYIRKIGNVGAHAGEERLSESEVRQAMTFTTILLKNLFEIPAQIEALEAQSPPPPMEG